MEEALIKRVLPHSIEGEQSVIGSMLMDREAIITASEIISAEDFYQHQYGIMFEAMIELFNEGKPVDLVTLQNRLKERTFRQRYPVWNLYAILLPQCQPLLMSNPMPILSGKKRF